MGKAAVVIAVQVCEDDSFHISRPNAHGPQLRTDFLIALDSKRDFPSHVGMQGLTALQQMSPLARIDHDHPFRMVDDPGIRWKPYGPVPILEYRETSS
jgi:hypothetical protein